MTPRLALEIHDSERLEFLGGNIVCRVSYFIVTCVVGCRVVSCRVLIACWVCTTTGDTVLKMVASWAVFLTHPAAEEGFLTEARWCLRYICISFTSSHPFLYFFSSTILIIPSWIYFVFNFRTALISNSFLAKQARNNDLVQYLR